MARTIDARPDATLRAAVTALPRHRAGVRDAAWTDVRTSLRAAARLGTNLADFLPYLLAERLRQTLVAARAMEFSMADEPDLVAELARHGFTRTQ